MNSQILLNKIEELEELEQELSQLDTETKKVKARVDIIMNKEIPMMLDDAGVEEIKVGPYKVKNGVIYRSNITKANQESAFQFLYDTDNDGIIKKTLTINPEQIDKAIAALKTHKIEFDTELKVDNRVLGRVVRELVEEGRMSTDDMEKFSIFVQPDVKITKPKK